MKYSELSIPDKWIIKGVPILFIIGSLFHFLYELCGRNKIVALISAVNESVWEHTKMVLLPVICWWVVYYFVRGKKYNIQIKSWFAGALTALFTSIMTIPMLFYFYTEAFGVELLVVDIIILFICLLLGQLLGLHIYKFSKGINPYIDAFIFVFILVLYAVFTFSPPHIAIFKDAVTGGYGVESTSFLHE